MDTLLTIGFRLHDFACGLIVKYLQGLKRLAHVVAFASLFGIFVPELRKEFGSLALNVLLVIMFLSPLSRLFRMRILLLLMGFRREMGILMGALALTHSLGYLMDAEWVALSIAPYGSDFFGIGWRIPLGFAAIFLTLPLWLTSNAWSQRLMGRGWRRLHWLAYPLLLVVLMHKFVLGGAGARDAVGMVLAGGMFGAYILTRVLAWKNFLPPLRSAIEYVASRYQEYQFRNSSGLPRTTSSQ